MRKLMVAAVLPCLVACGGNPPTVAPPEGLGDAGSTGHLERDSGAPDGLADPATDAGATGLDASDAAAVGPCTIPSPKACSGAQQSARWTAMEVEPIILPNRAAGLDLASQPSTGTWVDQAFAIDCQPISISPDSNCSEDVVWGTANDVQVNYDVTRGRPTFLALANTYNGFASFKSEDGSHSYELRIHGLYRDNRPMLLGWTTPQFEANVDEMYRAMMATFAPQVASDPAGTTCVQSKKCAIKTMSITIDSLGFELLFADAVPSSLPLAILLSPR